MESKSFRKLNQLQKHRFSNFKPQSNNVADSVVCSNQMFFRPVSIAQKIVEEIHTTTQNEPVNF